MSLETSMQGLYCYLKHINYMKIIYLFNVVMLFSFFFFIQDILSECCLMEHPNLWMEVDVSNKIITLPSLVIRVMYVLACLALYDYVNTFLQYCKMDSELQYTIF